MSSYIPFEIQVEIIKRVVDVKPLLCFRTVSKRWKSFIDSSEFITHHHNINHTRHLMARYNVDNEYKYVSIADDDSFPRHKFYHVVPRIIELVVRYPVLLDCSHGLVCLYGHNVDRRNMIVIWNPLIRKSIGVVMPSALTNGVGFGVCPKTLGPKIVRVTNGLKAEVFTLRTGAWKTIALNLPLESTGLDSRQVVVNGVIYWVAYDMRTAVFCNRIISFDLTSEEFGEVSLPYDLPASSHPYIYSFKESLALSNHNVDTLALDVWMMIKDGDSKSLFAKLFSLASDLLGLYHIVAFKMNEQSIMIHRSIYDLENRELTLKVYDPSSKHMNDLEIDVDVVYDSFFKMTSYRESLLLLDRHATIFQ